jgi:hypothetical protein
VGWSRHELAQALSKLQPHPRRNSVDSNGSGKSKRNSGDSSKSLVYSTPTQPQNNSTETLLDDLTNVYKQATTTTTTTTTTTDQKTNIPVRKPKTFWESLLS